MSFHQLNITSTQAEANDTLLVHLDVPEHLGDTFAFKQGQYLTFRATIDGQEVRRSYSICAGIGEPLAVAIKKIPDGAFSEFAHANFSAGTSVEVMAPQGEFTCELEAANRKRYLLIAAGSGITPIISIAKSVLAREPQSEVTLLYGNRRSADIIFKEQLLWMKNQYMARLQWVNIFSQEPQPAEILNGRIDNKKGAQLNRHLIDITGFQEFFLCGPEGMISEVSRGLRGMGITEDKIHYELFFASPEDAREAIARHKKRAEAYAGLTTAMTVRSKGREVAFELSADGENILDGALSAGLDLPFSCRGGVCATCKARVVEGEVEMDLNHVLTTDEVAQGYVLTCQSHPITDRVLVDFDVS